ncbi:MAG: 30S ribosomal protein S12 methylthiotransferase RimO [Clostridiales bacterium]|nr:30S ribosomal protein S12 methylthiotransferase RimO [Clostridiales bacterium]
MVSLGCDKNRVDSEIMLGILSGERYNIVNNERDADILIVNTCCFIESAKEESINTILELAENKKIGKCKALIVSGCLAERYADDLLSEIPEIDAVIGTGNYLEIDNLIQAVLKNEERVKRINNINYNIDFNKNRILTTPQYTAYVKIAEGCNNNCSYCIIPKLRGNYRSRSIESILNEIRYLAKNGTKEVILVAQDTSKYGIDLYGKRSLSRLIGSISKIDGIQWIRILYCYPEDIDDDLIAEIKNNDKVCKYLDIPIQHVNNEILKKMRRASSRESIAALIEKLRKNIPGIIIRTSLIAGFPGETEEQFKELYDFLKEYSIDRVGVFIYSREEGTEAFYFKDQIDKKIKVSRQMRLMTLQRGILRSLNKQKIGKVYRVLVEDIKDDCMIGRTYGDAPDIDGLVYVKDNIDNIKKGDFMDVKITGILDYDLVGVVEHEFS